ncbi:acyl-CoA dehydrogenase family protein [Amycolatopsis thermoflava]|uniref:Acyl-CoA dehydrogenase-like protein n=1 Tax=Amycolatopsis thermoflava TaxID=84480 RepID=A0A3N2H8N6_9PSEU|nr:acyl-CoA dehydrogenase family protein [Amycolatopsis thermoflava]ROS44475.1 acyl-CoA dehydrogenase-like protein [Amycolatopsis thermoflava]
MSEDTLLRETAAEIAEQCRPEQHDDCWKALTETGFSALRDADGDAPAATAAQTVVVVEEMAKVVCGAPLVGALLAGEALRLAGVALDEPLTVVLADDLGSLGAGLAWDSTAVSRGLALDQGELVTVALGAGEPSADLTRGVSRVGEIVGRCGATLGEAEARRFAGFARVLLTADLLGAAGGLFGKAVEYAEQRVQFGRPIGSFQAVQHLLARAFADLEAMRSTLAHAAHAIDTGDDAHACALVAKAYANEAAVSVVETAIQVFGGVAITWEFPAHLHLRRVVADAQVFGTADALYGLLHDEVEGVAR